MRETYQWGSTPYGEDCAQVGADDYYEKSRAECKRLIDGLTKKFGQPPMGMRYKVFANPHDFGTYHQVGVVYDGENPDHTDYLGKVDDGFPETWEELEK
jgi:hypothetical protein